MPISRRELLEAGIGATALSLIPGCNPIFQKDVPTIDSTMVFSQKIAQEDAEFIKKTIYTTSFYTQECFNEMYDIWVRGRDVFFKGKLLDINGFPLPIHSIPVNDGPLKDRVTPYGVKSNIYFNLDTVDNPSFLTINGYMGSAYGMLPERLRMIEDIKVQEEIAKSLAFVVGATAALKILGITTPIDFDQFINNSQYRKDMAPYFYKITPGLCAYSSVIGRLRGALLVKRYATKDRHLQYGKDPDTKKRTPLYHGFPIPGELLFNSSVSNSSVECLASWDDLSGISKLYNYFNQITGFKEIEYVSLSDSLKKS